METTEDTAQTNEFEYDCNICLGTAKNAVICICGHLYCWPCLHLWMLTPCSQRRFCPVCRSRLELAKMIPLYGRNNDVLHPSELMSSRPVAQRIEHTPEIASVYLDYIFDLHALLGYGRFSIDSLATTLNIANGIFGIFFLIWVLLENRLDI